jgi:hypothetical protein
VQRQLLNNKLYKQTSTNGGSDHTYPMVMLIEIIFLIAHNRVEYDSNI